MALKFSIDSDAISAQFGAFASEVKKDLQDSMEILSTRFFTKTKDLADAKLKSTYKTYCDNLSVEKIADGIWVVTLNEKALWLEEGIPASFDMKPGLLKGATKTSKTGNKYRSIPFEHSKNTPTTATPKAVALVNEIKSALHSRGINYKKIERDASGNPRLGKLHTLNIASEKPSAKASTPALRGLTIYQTKDNKTGKVSRSVMTFRTVSSGPGSEGKWIHPGMPANNFMDKAFEWMDGIWEKDILPEILKKYD